MQLIYALLNHNLEDLFRVESVQNKLGDDCKVLDSELLHLLRGYQNGRLVTQGHLTKYIIGAKRVRYFHESLLDDLTHLSWFFFW